MPIKLGEKIVLYDLKELAEKLNITPIILKGYLKNGELKGHKIGTKWYVLEENIRDFFYQYEKIQEKKRR